MFVSDLDGTLLDDDHKISKENKEAIKDLQDQGIKFVVATGRTKYILEDFLEQVDYKMPYIWSNGSAISQANGETWHTEQIPVKTVQQIIKLAHEHDIDYMIHTLDGLVAEHLDGRLENLRKYNESVKKEHQIPLTADPALYDNLESYTRLKFSANSESSQVLYEFQKIISEKIKGVNVVFSEATLLDVTAKDASKGAAVLKIAADYNIKPEEIVVIGDNENDISMFEVCGLALTLENAKDPIKAAASGVTKNNNDSGVADAIRRFVL